MGLDFGQVLCAEGIDGDDHAFCVGLAVSHDACKPHDLAASFLEGSEQCVCDGHACIVRVFPSLVYVSLRGAALRTDFAGGQSR